ncbi:MAG: extracellular solute-binding protein [Oscillospiraceae bacterium]|nr:extracellular solute-binding protein [Oscillospiraceae bacterium]
MKLFKLSRLLKIAALFLCMLLIILPVFACNSSEKPPNSENNNNINNNNDDSIKNDVQPDGEDSQPPDESQSRLDVSDDLPDEDFGGSKFNILYLTWGTYTDYYWAAEEIGEVMNDALYRRQRDVGERFNVEIEPIPTDYGTLMTKMGKSVKAGSHDYDMALTHYSNELAALITGNIILDWNKIPHLNFDKPWWSSKNAENEGLALNGKMYLVVSDFVIPDPNVTFFNKDLHKDLSLEDPYQLVRDGKWTYGKMHELAKAAGKDLNGDGQMTDADQYGLVTQLGWYFNSTANSAGLKAVAPDETGRLVYTDEVERIHNAIIAVDDIVNDKTCTFTYAYGAMGDQYISALPLSTGQVLFHWDPLFRALYYRSLDFDYGILPWPKLDDAQSRYYHFSHNGFMVLPQTTPDLDKAGIIVEALSAMSYKYVLPAYYDILMGIKLTRDLDSVEMLNLVYETCVFDPGRNYLEGSDPMCAGFYDLISKGNTDYISYHEKFVGKTQAWLDKFYDKVLELD